MNYAAEFRPFQERVIQLLKEVGFFKGIIYSKEAGRQAITIYGFWRLEKWEDDSGKVMHRALRRREDDYRQWEDVPYKKVEWGNLFTRSKRHIEGVPILDWPVGNTPLFSTSRRFMFWGAIETALASAVMASGFDAFFPEITPASIPSAEGMKFCLNDDYLGECKKYIEKSGERNKSEQKVNTKPSRRSASYLEKALDGELPWPYAYKLATYGKAYTLLMNQFGVHNKMFFSVFWKMADRPLYRIAYLSRIQGFPTLNDYMGFAKNREPAVALLKDKPNLVPLLNFIPMNKWDKPDILATKRWVNPSKSRIKYPLKFASAGAYRLLQHLSPKSVSRVCASARKGGDMSRFMENLLQAQIAPRLPFQLIKLLTEEDTEFLSPLMLRIIGREFLRLKGHRRFLPSNELANFERDIHLIKDWMDISGIKPERNATWNGLRRRAQVAHETPWEDALKHASTKPGWVDPLGQEERIIAGGLTARPLVSPASLIIEGMEMEHCLKWDFWRQRCEGGKLWCYSLTWNETQERSTLAIADRDGDFVIDQHYGRRNAFPSEQLQQGAQILLDMFRQAWKQAPEASRVSNLPREATPYLRPIARRQKEREALP